MTKLIKAFFFAIRAHWGQRRKYSGLPYVTHPIHVAWLVLLATRDLELVVVALLHDVIEDTSYTYDDIVSRFGYLTADGVMALTDRYTHKAFPALRRSERKALESSRLSYIPRKYKTVKLADGIVNSSDILKRDPKFAKVYLKEMKRLLSALWGGDAKLHSRLEKALTFH